VLAAAFLPDVCAVATTPDDRIKAAENTAVRKPFLPIFLILSLLITVP